MPKYRVRWTELNHFESDVEADSPSAAFDAAVNNLGENQDHQFGGYIENDTEIEVINA